MTEPDWSGDLEVLRGPARQPPTRDQRVWDGHWCRWWDRAIQQGRTPNQAAHVADVRTRDQFGSRPDSEENKP